MVSASVVVSVDQEPCRPLLSFVEMIHEALEASQTGMLSLQEIYEAVRKRYPYFRSKDTVCPLTLTRKKGLAKLDSP